MMDIDFSTLEGFEWDQGNLKHVKKHGVNYRECEAVFLNRPLMINPDETHSQIEERFRVYGQTDRRRLIFIIFTIRNNRIRVISARNQDKKERREYEKET